MAACYTCVRPLVAGFVVHFPSRVELVIVAGLWLAAHASLLPGACNTVSRRTRTKQKRATGTDVLVQLKRERTLTTVCGLGFAARRGFLSLFEPPH